MIQIRQGVFETNSSSVHAIAICTQDEWNKLQSGEYLVNEWGINDIISKDDPKAINDPENIILGIGSGTSPDNCFIPCNIFPLTNILSPASSMMC